MHPSTLEKYRGWQSLLTFPQRFQVYVFQIFQLCFPGLGQKHIRVGQEYCQSSGPQGSRTNGPHAHGEETCVLEERHVWRLRRRKMLLFPQDSWNLTSCPRLQWATGQGPRGGGAEAGKHETGQNRSAACLSPIVRAWEKHRHVPVCAPRSSLTQASGVIRETTAF